MPAKNKKILLLVDEHGGPGDPVFGFGVVMAPAAKANALAARLERRLSEEGLRGELRAAAVGTRNVSALLEAVAHADGGGPPALLAARGVAAPGGRITPSDRRRLYEDALAETGKAVVAHYKRTVARRPVINNVELIIDRNQYSGDPNLARDFGDRSRRSGGPRVGGHAKAIEHVAAIDSNASRLLQLADLAASTLAWLAAGEVTSRVLTERFGVKRLG
ncbi:MAG: DUF3800 domain-containing protein [Marivibrio sp.]|uniref:DUF3800 domain-containing protein n=1 Tax=Marivibrio sp. TaxID=2039719 RepID=UPI0032EEFCA0